MRYAAAFCALLLAGFANAGEGEATAAYRRGDYVAAMKEFMPLAEAGSAAAQLVVGFMYANGQGVEQDFVKAALFYRKSADQGNSAAQNNLGALYYNGKGVPLDRAAARELFQKSADQGNEQARNSLDRLSFADPPRTPSGPPLPPRPAAGSVEVAMSDLKARRPLPGLPDLRKPVYLAANSLICESAGALANPNTFGTTFTGVCAVVPRKIRVLVYPPTDPNDYVQAHVFKMVPVGARSGEVSDGNVYRGWVYIPGLQN